MEWTIFLLGIAAIGGALYWEHKERRNFARIQDEVMRPGRPGDLEAMSLVVQDLESELARTAEKIISELEAKSAELRGLIDEARRVEDLWRIETGGVSAAARVPAAQPPVLTVVPLPERAHSQPEAVPGPEPTAPVPPPAPDGWREREGAVYELANRGCTVGEIAKQLSIGKGEVRLILDLKKAQAK